MVTSMQYEDRICLIVTGKNKPMRNKYMKPEQKRPCVQNRKCDTDNTCETSQLERLLKP